jgi:Outer membrane protein beta-barrel domain
MKIACTVLFLTVAMAAYSQTSTSESNVETPVPQQPATPSHTAQQSNVQSQTPHQMNVPQSAAQPPKKVVPFYRWEIAGGYAHISGDEGMDGFNVGASVFLGSNISLGFNYDGVYDTTVLGSFALTNVGLTTSNSHLQDYMAGGRIFFPGVLKPHCGTKNVLPILHPFVQAQFGESNLYSKLTSVNIGTVSSSDTRFSWLLGGGGDIRFADHWSARISADLLRTHFADSGQSRIRIILGVVARF